jgi:hypothetical protein
VAARAGNSGLLGQCLEIALSLRFAVHKSPRVLRIDARIAEREAKYRRYLNA